MAIHTNTIGIQIPLINQKSIGLSWSICKSFLAAPTLRIAQRWSGLYAKHPTDADFVAAPAPGVRIVNGVGGAGMSTSFGLAEEVFASWT